MRSGHGPAQIMIVDDDPGVRDGLAAVLEAPHRTVRTFADGACFLDAVARGCPPGSLALIDLKMPGLSGLDILRALPIPPCPLVMMSAAADIPSAIAALKLGASDFLEKPLDTDALPILVDTLSGALMPVPAGAPLPALTPREKQIAALLAGGMTNKEVARTLGCSPRTVEVHRANLYKKLGVRNLAGMLQCLQPAGFVRARHCSLGFGRDGDEEDSAETDRSA